MTAKLPKRPRAFYCGNEDEGKISFLHSINQALRGKAWENVKPLPAYDCFAELGFVPAGLLFQNGWWFHCTECDRSFDVDCWDYDKDVALHPVFERDRRFCSQACRNTWHQNEQKVARLKAEAIAIVTAKYPGSVIQLAYVSLAYLDRPDKQRVDFKVLGVAGAVEWTSEQPDTVSVRRCDVEAWQAYKAGLEVSA
ncbi:MAG: hypothetical protein KME27_10910 [Lyngbya sp. HA4199-MV5]|jgi:hypothetical protein|nr:hypothetical protein [Lyngbya sp. HA4199-MV5]